MSEEFDAAVEPLRVCLLDLLDETRSIREENGFMPAATSAAMRELAAEDQYRGDWGQRPVESAHSWSGFLLAAAEDQLRTMCRVVFGDPSLYGPQILARSGLEAAGRAYWLTEPGITVECRVARYQTERLFNASEVRRLSGDVARATKIEKQITDTAKALGLSLLRGKKYQHTHVVEERPSGNKVFKSLLGDIEQHDLGHIMFSYLSAVVHGTAYGLLQAVDAVATTDVGPEIGALRVSSRTTNQLLTVSILGYATAVHRRHELFGWDDDHWGKVYRNALAQSVELIQREGEL